MKKMALVVTFYLLCYILPLGARDLTIPDETRYGEIPREMLAGHGWISPHLNGVRYFEKPVLGYWLHAASIRALGKNNFAVRFPSALAVGLSALALYLFLRHAVGWADVAEPAVLIFLSSLGVYGIGNTAVLDNIFSFFITAAAILFYVSTNFEPDDSRGLLCGIFCGFFCGAAFLVKGFVALAIPAVTFVPYLLWTRRIRDLPRRCFAPLVAFLLATLPWSILIHLREPDFWRFFFWNEHIRRFLAEDAQHARSFWFFFIVGPLLALPWTFFLPASSMGTIAALKSDEPQGRIVKFCLCWLLFPFLFFSVAHGKLPTYILPCYPPFAVLCALGLTKPLTAHSSKRRDALFRLGLRANLAFGALITAILLYLQFFKAGAFILYSHPSKVITILNCFALCALLCTRALRQHDPARKIRSVALSPLLLFVTISMLIPDATVEMKMPGRFLTHHAADVDTSTIVVTDDDTVGAVCWYLKREDVYVLGGAGELAYGFAREDPGRNIDAERFAELVQRFPGRVVLIAEAEKIDRLQDARPQNFVAEARSEPFGHLVWRRY